MSPFACVSSGRKIVILSTVIVALCLIAPVGFLILYAGGDLGLKPLDHLQQTNLNLYIRNSLFLALGVAFFSVIMGTLTAWLVTFYSFPFKRILRVGLIFPLAFPSYILAITYGSSLDEAGWVQSLIRKWFDISYGDYPFFDIRSLGGAIFVLSCSLYPYVYIMAYNSFKKQSRSLWEIAQTLGANNWQLLRRLILPISRPAIIVGVTLVIMETLADYGVVDLFGVPSFTTGIYRTWFNMHDRSGAILLSTILLLFVVVLIYVEYHQRRKVNYTNENADYSPNSPRHLKGMYAFGATFICAAPLVLGFLIPLFQLLYWSVLSSHTIDMMSVWNDAFNSLLVAFLSACSVIVISLLFVYALRYQHTRQKPLAILVALASKGYAIPGSVIAIGVLIITTKLDHAINNISRAWFDMTLGLLFSSSMLTLIFAYSMRFLTLGLGSVQTSIQSITPTMDHVSLSLGKSELTTFIKIHIPILKPALFTAFLFVFVDVIKELPATLILRPFNFDTLAIKTYDLASDERYISSAMPALMLVIAGMIPIIVLYRYIMKDSSDSYDTYHVPK